MADMVIRSMPFTIRALAFRGSREGFRREVTGLSIIMPIHLSTD